MQIYNYSFNFYEGCYRVTTIDRIHIYQQHY